MLSLLPDFNTMSELFNTLMQRGYHLCARIADLYIDGFRNMTVGRTLWAIIGLKLVVFFLIMRLCFFPNLLKRDFDTDDQRADHVRHELTSRYTPLSTSSATYLKSNYTNP